MQHNINTTTLSVVPPKLIVAKADSGATNHYFTQHDAKTLNNYVPTIYLPNGDTITATHQGLLPCSDKLSHQAKITHVFDDLQTSSSISVGQLCDDKCKVLLDENCILVYKNNEIILTGSRNKNDGLWDIPIVQHPNTNTTIQNSFQSHSKTPSHSLNVILTKKQTKKDLM